MKKFFTLIAAALMAVGANAQTTIASYDAGTKTGTWSIVGTSAASGSLEYTAKYNKNATEVTTITFPNGATSSGEWNYAVKVEGDFKAGDVVTIQPFTQMSATDFEGGTKYANILLYYEKEGAPKQIADLTGSAGGALTVTDGHEEEGTPKEFTYTLEADYTSLFFARGGNTRINLMKVTVVRGSEGGGSEGGGESGESEAIASWDQEVSAGATFTAVGATQIADFTGKIDKNTTQVKCMTFTSSAWAKATAEATETSFLNYVKVEIDGGFKTGDVVTIQPFTQMSATDFEGGSKYANIVLYDAEGGEIKNMTGSAAGALTVTDGHEEEGTPKEFSYTLEKDYAVLCFGRQGNTRINVIKIVVERPAPTAVAEVKAEAQAAPAVKKVFKNGKLIIINGANEFNVAGQLVK